ncbi:hypothetical protein CVT25_004958 [Psilocybe cyanescens]|uniref:Uncharacterized protein n=1 Tax=Psilocybe cyanescens TaxID=93625 RepID=A0A409XTY9_PSICY|nr:hypothetical protein CVT25_004958 [Psilocybe cyanescens]
MPSNTSTKSATIRKLSYWKFHMMIPAHIVGLFQRAHEGAQSASWAPRKRQQNLRRHLLPDSLQRQIDGPTNGTFFCTW